MTLRNPSPYQRQIRDASCDPLGGNILVQAVAGSGKTTTIVWTAEEMVQEGYPFQTPPVFLAFNKAIAEELKSRLPSVFNASTFHSYGLRMLPRGIKIDGNKYGRVARGLFPEFDWDTCNEISKIINTVFAEACPPNADAVYGKAEQVIADMREAGDDVDFTPTAVMEVFGLGWDDKSSVCFEEMIYIPVFAPMTLPRKASVAFVDEAQDLSPLQHQFLRKYASRVIAVGDRSQAIYGFRGADYTSMDKLAQMFNMRELPLSVCYRCPELVVKQAQLDNPTILPRENAPQGEVKTISYSEFVDDLELGLVSSDAAVICRTNRHIISLCYRLMKKHISFQVRSEFFSTVQTFIKKMKATSLAHLIAKLDAWLEAEQARKPKPRRAQELAEKHDSLITLCTFLQESGKDDVQDLYNLLDSISQSRRGVTLATIHKAKGLEWDDVYFLFPEAIPSIYAETDAEIQQEWNMRYVAVTRAGDRLFYVKADEKGN